MTHDWPDSMMEAFASLGPVGRLRWRAANAVMDVSMWLFNHLTPRRLQQAGEISGDVKEHAYVEVSVVYKQGVKTYNVYGQADADQNPPDMAENVDHVYLDHALVNIERGVKFPRGAAVEFTWTPDDKVAYIFP